MLPIKGFEKVSGIDFPDNLASVIFLSGCNFRCPYCHNPDLVKEGCNKGGYIDEKDILDYLKVRKDLLDGLCITGGEPLLHDLRDFINSVKDIGMKVKLDTNGSFPEKLNSLIKNVDYVAMDIKAPLDRYSEIINAPVNTNDIKESINIIRNSGVDYEFRTTLVPDFLSETDVLTIAKTLLKKRDKYVLQGFRCITPLLDDSYEERGMYSFTDLVRLEKTLSKSLSNVSIR